jgi:hypothetical protein
MATGGYIVVSTVNDSICFQKIQDATAHRRLPERWALILLGVIEPAARDIHDLVVILEEDNIPAGVLVSRLMFGGLDEDDGMHLEMILEVFEFGGGEWFEKTYL